MYDYTIRHFLGIFLITIPLFVWLIAGIFRFFYTLLSQFLEVQDKEHNFFHHHFHYKDKR